MDNSKLIYRPSELAEALGVSRTTLFRMEKRNELPPRRKISESTRGWPRSEIEEWINDLPVADSSLVAESEEGEREDLE